MSIETFSTTRGATVEIQNTKRLRRLARPWVAKHKKNNADQRNPELQNTKKTTQTSATLSCKTQKKPRRPAQPWVAKHKKTTQTSRTLNCKTQEDYADQRNPELQNIIRLRRPAQPWVARRNKTMQTSATLRCKAQRNCDIQGSISWALKQPLHCAEQFLDRILREGSSSKTKMRVALQCTHSKM